MSADRIKKAAMERFAAQGYDAAALAEIARDVGIKTPSIYAHFTGKQDLFLQLVDEAAGQEIAVTRAALQQREPVRDAMRRYLYGTLERFTTEPHLHFWLRSIYLPPVALYEAVSGYDKKFAQALKDIVAPALRDEKFGLRHPILPHDTLTLAFIGILRGLHAELLYCSSTEPASVLEALWAVFERSCREL